MLSRFVALFVSLIQKASLFQLAAELAPGSAVGVDPALFKAATEAEYQAKWGTRLTIKHLPANLVDTIWMTRPIDPANNILIHPEELAGESVRDKLARVRAALADEKVAALILNALDQVRSIQLETFRLRAAVFRFLAVRSLLLPRCVFLPSSCTRSPGCSTCGARISSATRCSLPTPSCCGRARRRYSSGARTRKASSHTSRLP